ncbi:MAG: flagellar hook-associated protein FlgL [Pseudomonadota bacterium]
MRVANLMICNAGRYRLNQTLSAMTEANRAISSGKRVNEASDDPVAAGRILQIESSLSYMDQIGRSIDTGKKWLETQESTLNSVLESILDARDTALAMSNATCNADDLATAGDAVHQLLLTMVDLSNSQVDGNYLFSGTKTDTCPYVLDDPDNPTLITYQGNDAAFSIQIRQNATLAVGYSGEAVFGSIESGEDIFSLLFQMEDDLRNNGGGNLGTFIAALDSHYERVVNTVSSMGVKTNRLEMTETILAELELTLTSDKSGLEDADIVESITLLTQRQTAYEASLAATSKIMSLSLVDYM